VQLVERLAVGLEGIQGTLQEFPLAVVHTPSNQSPYRLAM
jgi:hypothetical protein